MARLVAVVIALMVANVVDSVVVRIMTSAPNGAMQDREIR
jgi:hypothetical protein